MCIEVTPNAPRAAFKKSIEELFEAFNGMMKTNEAVLIGSKSFTLQNYAFVFQVPTFLCADCVRRRNTWCRTLLIFLLLESWARSLASESRGIYVAACFNVVAVLLLLYLSGL